MKLKILLDDPRMSREEISAAVSTMVSQLPQLDHDISAEYLQSDTADSTAKSPDQVVHGAIEVLIRAGEVAGALKAIYEFLKVAFPEGVEGQISGASAEREIKIPKRDLAESIKSLQQTLKT